MEKKSINQKTLWGAVLLLLSFGAFFNICRFAAGSDIWYDEVFSVSFAKMTFGDIIEFTARDVHPPFYYFYLKVLTSIACGLFGDSLFIPAAKAASLLPWVLLLILGATYIRKNFGFLTFGLFMFLITTMPQLSTYFVEIRMYSLALFLITSEILLTHYLITHPDKKNTLYWFLFWGAGILTAYTQYYACIAVIGSYVALFLLLLFNDKTGKKRSIRRLLFCAIASIVLYLPWLPLLKRQIDHVSGSYWIQPLTLRSIAGCVKFVILPVVYMGKWPVISAILTIVTVLVLAVLFIIKREKNDLFIFCCCLSPVVIVIASGFILSALGTPIFVYRYLVPTLGGVWLLVSIMAERAANKNICMVLVLPFLLSAFLCIKGFDAEEGGKLFQEKAAMEAIKDIPENSVIITNFDHVTAIMAFYRPDCKVLLYEAGIDPLLPDMMGNITDNISDEDVHGLVMKNDFKDATSTDDIYFLGSFNSREDIVNSWENLGIHSTLKDSVLIERYWINLYVLE